MILLKNDILFIHRNKCGGSSLRSFFDKHNLVLEDYKEYGKDYPGKVKYFEGVPNRAHGVPLKKEHKWVTVTREPVSWYKSFFNFHVQKQLQRPPNAYKHPNSKLFTAFNLGYEEGKSFDVFVDYIYRKNWPAFTYHYMFFNSRADYVLNLENLEEELFEFAKQEYGLVLLKEKKVEVVNKTLYNKYNIPTEVSQQSIDKIKTLESRWYQDGVYINSIK